MLNQHGCLGGTRLAANSDKDQLKNSYGPVGDHVQIQNFCFCYDANCHKAVKKFRCAAEWLLGLKRSIH